MRVRSKRMVGGFAAGLSLAAIGLGYRGLSQSGAAQSAASTDWPTAGPEPGGLRFSPVTQLPPANVSQLKVAWVYHMRPATDPAAAPAQAAAAGAANANAGAIDAPPPAAQ